MTPRRFVLPLEDAWRAALSRVLGQTDAFDPKRVAALAPKLEELSRAYNLGLAEGRRTALPLEARVAFSFPRDVPKGAAAVREVASAGRLVPDGRPLRVLDLGAGLGAMTWGIARAALASAPEAVRVESVLVDEDAAVLRAAKGIARAAAETGAAPARLTLDLDTRTEPLARVRDLRLGRFDVVMLGQVLSEVDLGLRADPPARAAEHAKLVAGLLDDVVAPDGSLVIVEPALRDRTRHLHAVRDRVLDLRPDAAPFAPCLHRAGCPMLPVEGEWCHEDLPVDLPAWVAPLARAAGLRFQGLTFAYLVLRKDGLAFSRPEPEVARFRVVSDLLRSKGKEELFACTAEGERRRLRRLDRDRDDERGVRWGDLRRGDVVRLRGASGPPIDDRNRVQAGAHAAIDGARTDK